MEFNFDSKITREYLLKKNSEETYMSYYLRIPVKKCLFISPLRADNHKTCSFFRGKSGNLYFKDFATGECLTFEGVVMKQHNCTYQQALRIIAKDFGYVKGSIPKKEIKIQPKFESDKQTFIQVEIKEFSEAELKWWASYGITKEVLKRFNVHSCQTVFLNGNITARSTQCFPIYGYYFGKKGSIEQWRIYLPQNKHNGYKFIGNVSSKTIQGYKQLPKEGKLLVITKSQKDNMALYAYGISAISPNSEHLFISDTVLENLKKRFEHIIVLYDQDRAGKYNLAKIRRNHPELDYFVIPKQYNAKDFSDLRKIYGFEETKKLILQVLKYFKQKWKKNT